MLNEIAFSLVAGYSLTGMLTSPNVMLPFQTARGIQTQFNLGSCFYYCIADEAVTMIRPGLHEKHHPPITEISTNYFPADSFSISR
jgi:hypothetical protein